MNVLCMRESIRFLSDALFLFSFASGHKSLNTKISPISSLRSERTYTKQYKFLVSKKIQKLTNEVYKSFMSIRRMRVEWIYFMAKRKAMICGDMPCPVCPAWFNWAVLVVGVLYLLGDLGLFTWFSDVFSWWTVVFVLAGLKLVCKNM